jgi:HK97 family phage prohead protease
VKRAMNQRGMRWGTTGKEMEAKPLVDVANVSAESPILATEALALPGMQRRTFARALSVERRSAGSVGGRTVYGAIPFDRVVEMGDGVAEVFKYGCFAASIGADDPRVVWCLNPECVVGRKSSGTASFVEDRSALRFEADVPATSWGDDMLTLIRRGDVDAVSIVCYVKAAAWGELNGQRVRNITRAQLVVTSIVSFDGFATAQADAAQALAAAHAAGMREGIARGFREDRAEARRAAVGSAGDNDALARRVCQLVRQGGMR